MAKKKFQFPPEGTPFKCGFCGCDTRTVYPAERKPFFLDIAACPDCWETVVVFCYKGCDFLDDHGNYVCTNQCLFYGSKTKMRKGFIEQTVRNHRGQFMQWSFKKKDWVGVPKKKEKGEEQHGDD